MKKMPTSTNNKEPNLSIKGFPIVYWILIAVFIIFAVFMSYRSVILFKAERHYREGYFLLQRKLGRYAARELKQAVKYAPWETQYSLYLGKAYEEHANRETNTGKKVAILKKAIPVYEKIIVLNDHNPWYKNRLAYVYLNLGNLDAKNRKKYNELAYSYSKQAAADDRKNPLFQQSHAQLLHRLNLLDEAIPYYESVIEYDDRILDAPYNLADIYFKKGNVNGALEKYLYIYQKNPNFQNTNFAIAQMYILKRETALSIPYLEKELVKKPDNVKSRKLLGMAYYQSRRWKDAVDTFEPLPQPELSKKEVFTIRVESIYRSGDKNKAKELISQRLKTSPKDKDILKLKDAFK